MRVGFGNGFGLWWRWAKAIGRELGMRALCKPCEDPTGMRLLLFICIVSFSGFGLLDMVWTGFLLLLNCTAVSGYSNHTIFSEN